MKKCAAAIMTMVTLINASGYPEFSDRECRGPLVITPPKEFLADMKMEPVTSTIWNALPAKAISVRITRKTKYCTSAAGLRLVASCDKATRILTLDRAEILESDKDNRCKVGEQCNVNSCSSDRAEICHSDLREKYMAPGEQEYHDIGNKVWYYSCLQTWTCEIERYNILPIPAPDGKFSYRTIDGANADYSSETHFGGNWNTVLTKPFVERTIKTIQCLNQNGTRACRYQDNPPKYVIVRDGIGVDQNNLITIGTPTADIADQAEPVRNAELQHVVGEVVESHMILTYNVLVLETRIHALEKILTDLLNRGSPNKAVSDIVGKWGTVRFLPGGVFLICDTREEDLIPTYKQKAIQVPLVRTTPDLLNWTLDERYLVDESLKAELKHIEKDIRIREEDNSDNPDKGGSYNIFDAGYDLIWKWFTRIGALLGILSFIRR